MNYITVDSFISAMAEKAYNSITPAPKLYKDQVEQGLSKPCFFIKLVNVSQDRIGVNWYKRTLMMQVRYMPSDGSKKYAACREAAEALSGCLDEIDLVVSEDQTLIISSTKMDYKIEDEVLLFYVNYEFKVKKEVQAPPIMGSLDADVFLKN